MTGKKVFLITGAGRGMGADIVRSALAAGHAVVATGRNPKRVSEALGAHEDLLVTALDVTDPASARTAVEAAVGRFGRIDVLANQSTAANRRCAGPRALTPSRPSSRRPGPCSTRPTPTETCHPPSPTPTPERLA